MEEDDTCPLCLEQLDITDKHIEFCLSCDYRMCLWCWHRIMENAAKDNRVGCCPNCRREYDKERITKGQVDPTKLAKEQEKKRKKDSKLKYKPGEGMSRKHLQNVRVIQRNLVYAIGVPLKHCKEETLKKQEFFGKYGEITKISVNRNGPNGRYGVYTNGKGPTGSAYVTFKKESDAVLCIKKIDGSIVDGNVIKACFGTTKYCNSFLKYQQCNNPDCLYLHEIGEEAESFTKEEMARIGTKHHSFHVPPPQAAQQAQQVCHPVPVPVPMPSQQANVPPQVHGMRQAGDVNTENGASGMPGVSGFPLPGAAPPQPQVSPPDTSQLSAGEMFLNHIQQMMQGNQANLLGGGGGFNLEPGIHFRNQEEMQYSGRTKSRFSFANTNSEEETLSVTSPPGFSLNNGFSSS
ncbi:CCR4-NOT transcription complex protein [Chloropicon primus]|uniref:CCR4-NOT transcription complex protein n=1 Tax=Chloropicon primus TaxID=1764295 RepID=A0A5B8MLN1_9CHLO|nr:CCR4-NOT transcription complex protein [Chloropicon primus]UPR00553.1 CCR4-NOT transcription complex protein [Chloropicon primus]|mmetsp:Transcript_8968/g.25570  ORF Transcript_8968/g.25570 Transcript_8968/m.25570 type:complete len:406 (-) Transcript_8968:1303-2520(-)|eukprot:QDZ21337.1 CCR4-NOT transcription complex protein [Chloropicon primus]